MMRRTWSLEESLIRVQSALAVAVQGVWDVFTNRPTYSNQHRIPGCPNASDCRDHGCAGDCSEALDSPAYEQPLAEWEQELRDAFIQDRYETSADVPRNGSAEHPAGGLTHSPESPRPAPQLNWHGWSIPAILEVLAEHLPEVNGGMGRCPCGRQTFYDWPTWAEHVAPHVADRIGCDPARAIAALYNTPQK